MKNAFLVGERIYLRPLEKTDAPLLKDRGYPFEYIIPPETPEVLECIALIKGAPNAAGATIIAIHAWGYALRKARTAGVLTSTSPILSVRTKRIFLYGFGMRGYRVGI